MKPCHQCKRHIRDLHCPFCGADHSAQVESELASAETSSARGGKGLTRAALMLGAAVALGACDNASNEALYGGPPMDATVQDGGTGDSSNIALYGAPPMDGGSQDGSAG